MLIFVNARAVNHVNLCYSRNLVDMLFALYIFVEGPDSHEQSVAFKVPHEYGNHWQIDRCPAILSQRHLLRQGVDELTNFATSHRIFADSVNPSWWNKGCCEHWASRCFTTWQDAGYPEEEVLQRGWALRAVAVRAGLSCLDHLGPRGHDDQSSTIKVHFKNFKCTQSISIPYLWNAWNPKNMRMPLLTLVECIWHRVRDCAFAMRNYVLSLGVLSYFSAALFRIVSGCFGVGKSAPAVVREPCGFKSASLCKRQNLKNRTHQNSSVCSWRCLLKHEYPLNIMNFEIKHILTLRSLTRSRLPLLCHTATCGVRAEFEWSHNWNTVTTLDVNKR